LNGVLEESDVSVDLVLEKTFSIGQTLSLNHGGQDAKDNHNKTLRTRRGARNCGEARWINGRPGSECSEMFVSRSISLRNSLKSCEKEWSDLWEGVYNCRNISRSKR
jgi:hypothetical protein